MKETRIRIEPGGPRPPYSEVAHHLWGGADIDSDGNSNTADSTAWTELTLINRTDTTQRVDIDPLSQNPLVLEVRSETYDLAESAAQFLTAATNGKRITEHDGGLNGLQP